MRTIRKESQYLRETLTDIPGRAPEEEVPNPVSPSRKKRPQRSIKKEQEPGFLQTMWGGFAEGLSSSDLDKYPQWLYKKRMLSRRPWRGRQYQGWFRRYMRGRPYSHI